MAELDDNDHRWWDYLILSFKEKSDAKELSCRRLRQLDEDGNHITLDVQIKQECFRFEVENKMEYCDVSVRSVDDMVCFVNETNQAVPIDRSTADRIADLVCLRARWLGVFFHGLQLYVMGSEPADGPKSIKPSAGCGYFEVGIELAGRHWRIRFTFGVGSNTYSCFCDDSDLLDDEFVGFDIEHSKIICTNVCDLIRSNVAATGSVGTGALTWFENMKLALKHEEESGHLIYGHVNRAVAGKHVGFTITAQGVSFEVILQKKQTSCDFFVFCKVGHYCVVMGTQHAPLSIESAREIIKLVLYRARWVVDLVSKLDGVRIVLEPVSGAMPRNPIAGRDTLEIHFMKSSAKLCVKLAFDGSSVAVVCSGGGGYQIDFRCDRLDSSNLADAFDRINQFMLLDAGSSGWVRRGVLPRLDELDLVSLELSSHGFSVTRSKSYLLVRYGETSMLLKVGDGINYVIRFKSEAVRKTELLAMLRVVVEYVDAHKSFASDSKPSGLLSVTGRSVRSECLCLHALESLMISLDDMVDEWQFVE